MNEPMTDKQRAEDLRVWAEAHLQWRVFQMDEEDIMDDARLELDPDKREPLWEVHDRDRFVLEAHINTRELCAYLNGAQAAKEQLA